MSDASSIVTYGDLIRLLGKKDVEILEKDKVMEIQQAEIQSLNETISNLQKELESVNTRRAQRTRAKH